MAETDVKRGTLDLPPYDGIGLPDEDARILADYAKDKIVLEVGSWLGRSTIAMARTATLVVSVDTHLGPPIRSEGPTLNEFILNLRQYGVLDKVVPIVGDFARCAWLLHSHFEMAFIDAAHDGVSVLRDAKAASLLCRPGSPILFHDYATANPVRAAVHELSKRWDRPYKELPGANLALIYKA